MMDDVRDLSVDDDTFPVVEDDIVPTAYRGPVHRVVRGTPAKPRPGGLRGLRRRWRSSREWPRTVARETMAEHEKWRVIFFFERAQGLIEELQNRPEDKKDCETIRLLNELMKRVNAKFTDEL